MKKLLLLSALAIANIANAQNTFQTYDIVPGINGASPSNLTVFNNRLYFYATDENYNQQIWSTDGINAPVKTIVVGKDTGLHWNLSSFTGKRCMAVLGNKLYFAGRDEHDTIRIYNTDGKNISSISLHTTLLSPNLFTTFRNQLYFSLYMNSSVEVFRLNPADNSITRVTGLSSTANVGFSDMIELNGKLIISGRDQNGYKMWEHNPINNTTVLIDSAAFNHRSPSVAFAKMEVDNNILYYNDDIFFKTYTGSGLPKTVTRMDIPFEDSDFMISNGTIFYVGTAALGGNKSLSWKNTQTEVNKQLKDASGHNIDDITRFGKYLSSNVFLTNETYIYSNSTNIWLLNNTNTPTKINNLSGVYVYASDLIEFNGSLYFITSDIINGVELSKYTNESLNTASISNTTLSASAYPNPANEYTTISFDVKSTQQISIQVTDMQGRVVHHTPVATYNSQKHTVQISMQSLPSGIYNFAINNGDAVLMASGKIVKE